MPTDGHSEKYEDEELHGFRPSRWDALRYFDLAIARHDELVRRVHHLRGEPLPEREAVAS